MKHGNKRVILTVLGITLLLTACSTEKNSQKAKTETKKMSAEMMEETTGAQKISAEEAYERMQSGDPITILDVRTAEEYAQAHIKGAVLLPNEDIGDTAPAELPDLDAEILIYCRSGNRSAQAAKKLEDLGYTNLYDFGGIKDWPYETETGE